MVSRKTLANYPTYGLEASKFKVVVIHTAAILLTPCVTIIEIISIISMVTINNFTNLFSK